jgi:hypothetical protein
MGIIEKIREINDNAYARRLRVPQEMAKANNAEQNKSLFQAVAGDALANPAFADAASGLLELPASQAQTGLMALLQRGMQGAAGRGPTLAEQAQMAGQDRQLERSMDMAKYEGQQLSNQEARMRLAFLPEQQAMQISEAQRTALNFNITNAANLRDEVNKDPMIIKAQNALTSYDQFLGAIDQNNTIALQAAIVGLAQVQEPGLAVRQDDRIAYTGNNPVMDQLVQGYNANITGEVSGEIRRKMIDLATRLAAPQAQNAQRILQDYIGIAMRTPGVSPQDVIAGTGLDPDLLAALAGQ